MHDCTYVIVALDGMTSSDSKVSQSVRWRYVVAQHHIGADEISCLKVRLVNILRVFVVPFSTHRFCLLHVCNALQRSILRTKK
jgi:hypothetical protein